LIFLTTGIEICAKIGSDNYNPVANLIQLNSFIAAGYRGFFFEADGNIFEVISLGDE